MKKLLLLLSIFTSSVSAQLLITGAVQSSSSQSILAPMVNSGQAGISEMTAEGTWVSAGDIVVQFDASEIDSKIKAAEEDITLFEATRERDLVKLELDQLEVDFHREKTAVELKIAKMNASVPADFIGDLAHSENQLTLTRAQTAYEEAIQAAKNTAQKIAEKQLEFKLGAERKQAHLIRWQRKLDTMAAQAKQSGFIIHQQHPWTGAKFQPGDRAQASMHIATVSDSNNLLVKAWINAVDLPAISVQSGVTVYFDALPQTSIDGRLTQISSAGEPVPSWGDGLYYQATVELDHAEQLSLLPGMSALVVIPSGERT